MTNTPCPHCGEPVEPRQLVCLNCGGRVALRERVPLGREPVTALAAVLVAVTVVGAVLFGFAISELTSGDGDDGGSATRASAPVRAEERAQEPEAPAVVSGTTQKESSPQEPERQEAQPEETQPEQPPPEPERGVPGWPKGLTAHTVVLVTSSDRPAALGVAREARASGLEAGLIRSDPYNLGTGLWIVYAGRFTTREGAQAQAGQLAERYPGAYAQLVQGSQ